MDSRQSGSKRSADAISLQNQKDDNVSSIVEGGNDAKRFKQQLDPLLIENVIEKILSYLDTESIKNARQVHPLWSIEGAKVLIAKCYVEMPSKIHAGKTLATIKVTDKFRAFLACKSNEVWMVPNIKINKVEDVKLLKYFGILGPQVKSLKLKVIGEEANWLHNLLALLPNLKYLNLEDTKLSRSQSAISVINVLISVMSKDERAGNTLVVSSLTLERKDLLQLDIEQFSHCKNLVIDELTFTEKSERPSYWASLELRIAMNKLLTTSRKTLKSLNVDKFEPFLMFLELSCMTALSRISLDWGFMVHSARCLRQFSPAFQFATILPNLKEFCIDLKELQSHLLHTDFLQHLFEHTEPAPSVKSVKYLRHDSDFAVDPFFETFPNLEEYTTSVNEYSETMFCSLWNRGKNLKKLVLYFDYVQDLESFDDLNYIFTGFAPETMNKLKTDPNFYPLSLEELQELRVNPSILNLKELRHLELHFREHPHQNLPQWKMDIAGTYAFKYLPGHIRIFLDVVRNGNKDRARQCVKTISELHNVSVEFEKTGKRCYYSNYNNVYFYIDDIEYHSYEYEESESEKDTDSD